jgi:CheY-like chemotaxis protein
VSPQIERLLELTAEQAFDVGDFWTPRLHELDREHVLRHWRAWCAEPAARPFRHTYRLLTRSGRAVWVEDVTVLAERGGARSFQRHLLDITERHQLRLLGAAEFERPEEPQPVPTAPLGGQEAILVVEDEPAVRVLEEMTLEDAGYVVHAAADAEEALGLAGRHGVDLVVVDVVLPGLSGTQLVDELAARGCDVPAVFVSGYGGDENAIRGLETRAAAVVAKPFAPEDLLRAVREALDAAAATVVPLRAKEATQSQLVRCLRCGAHYRRPLPHLSLASTTCPKCHYVGWAALDERSAGGD